MSEKPARPPFYRWRWFLIGVPVLVVLIVLMSALGGGGAVAYKTQALTRGTLTVTVSATGSVQPLDQVDVGAEITGRVTELHADYNDQVKQGQVLARLDTSSLEAKVAQSEANLLSAQASVAEAKAALRLAEVTAERTQALADNRYASQQARDRDIAELARARAALQSAEAGVKVAEAVLSSDRSTLDKATIRSPVDGVVISRSIELGQTIVASLQTPVLFTVARDLTRMELNLDVDEADIGHIKVGQKASFSVDAYPTRRFDAEVTSVRLAPKSEQGVVTYQVLARVDNPDMALRPGMTATADVIGAVRADVVLVPNGALRFTPPEKLGEALPALAPDQGRLWLDDGGSPRAVTVTLGLSDGRQTEIGGPGLDAGTAVIVDIQRPALPR
ncbi:efflux RND transporter periplasmic adaptor subunit [Zavarzinia compransoris]|uniref:Efflux RND transporter periplasmic adaptor subunit n=1 Tax=Zavarzinia compransoris TaxID=1264899 RepID=A0A317EAW0_9PROT|nr:efflux RND transporter periplasmic adaptor subunit [Zavarzinia compransoris]PWR23414.1 efflux RND transporter periplasmic adaptor subunit [Zavarzinia compransoris]TDP46010.1 HlyD family secretion protein [Zavarzinia compransoris]